MKFTTITQLPASDLVRARAWYKEKLGIEQVTADGELFEPGDADPWTYALDYDSGTARFSVYQTPHAGKNPATAMRLVTDEFDAVHTELLARGVVFEIYDVDESFHEPDGTPYWENGALISPDGEKTAWFKDSEGNVIAVGSCR